MTNIISTPNRPHPIRLSNQSAGTLIRAVFQKNKSVRLKAAGNSMYPGIQDGDVITLTPVRNYHPETGDILVCINHSTGQTVIHRLIRQVGNRFFTKGDFCFRADGDWTPDEVLGYVSRIHSDSMFSQKSIQKKYKHLIAHLSIINILTIIGRFRKRL